MAGDDITFGCGAFLPGEGPFNFLDVDMGGMAQVAVPPLPPWLGERVILDEDDPPEIPKFPNTPFPTYPNDIIIVRNDPFNSWVNRDWPPYVGWSTGWEIVDIIIKDAAGNTPTHGWSPYVPSFDNSTGTITLPSIPERTWDNGPPKTLTVNLLWTGLGNAGTPPFPLSNTYTLLAGNQGGISIGDELPGVVISPQSPPQVGGTLGGGDTVPGDLGTIVPQRPTFYDDTQTIVIREGSMLGGVASVLPVEWRPGTIVTHLNVFALGASENNYASVSFNATNPQIYNWNGWNATYRKVTFNSTTGKIKLEHIRDLFLPNATPHAMRLHVHNTEDGASEYLFNIDVVRGSGGTVGSGETDDQDWVPFTVGGGPVRVNLPRQRGARRSRKLKEVSPEEIVRQSRKLDKVNLNDPSIISSITSNYPTGLLDFDIAYRITPTFGKMVSNTTGSSDLLSNRIDENLSYIINNNEKIRNWDSTKPGGVNTRAVLRSLTPKALNLISKIRNYDGTPLSESQKYGLVGSRAMDGTLGNVNYPLLNKLVSDSDKAEEKSSNFEIIPSTSMLVNEVAALAYIERNYFPLDPEKSESLMRRILPNWKVFATDVDKHIEIRIANGTLKKFYVKDDNTLVDRSSIKVQDGDFVEVKVGGVLKRFFCKSEIDHSFMMPEKVRMKAVTLLGGDSSRTLSVSADVSDEIEFNYSLSSPRQNFYVLSAVLSSTVTQPTHQGSYLLKDTTLTYELMDTSSTEGLSSVNDYIQYKANSLTYILDDDDRILDYIETTGKLEVRQTDILTDSPKTTKSTPLLTRQIPWYIIVYPTNRPDYNIFNAKSFITSYESSGITSRSIRTVPSTAPEFNRSAFNIFVPQVIASTTSLEYPDAVGDYSLQTRVAKISAGDSVYQTGYRKNIGGAIGSAQTVNPPKLKTTFRVIKEIITELNNNYILEWDSLGRTLTTFDVVSRLNLKQFSKFISIENYALLFPLIKKGIIDNVKVFEPTVGSSLRLTEKKTQLVMRRSNAGEDTFPSIMAMPTGYMINPPTTEGPTFGVRQPVTPASVTPA